MGCLVKEVREVRDHWRPRSRFVPASRQDQPSCLDRGDDQGGECLLPLLVVSGVGRERCWSQAVLVASGVGREQRWLGRDGFCSVDAK